MLQIKAIKLQPENPYVWASGWHSPIYCDNRIALSYPEARTFIKKKLARNIRKQYPQVEMIAGIATAGIAIGALVADELELPFAYIRPEPKPHGRGNQIEGNVEKGQKIVLVEDLISTGKSCLKAIPPLQEIKAKVLGVAAIFNYGFVIADENFKAAKCPFFSLSDYDFLLDTAIEKNYINSDVLKTLKKWRLNPDTWVNSTNASV